MLNLFSHINHVYPIDLTVKEIFVNYSDFTKDYYLEGELIVGNKTSKTIKLPKSFDLQIMLTDKNGKVVQDRTGAIFEYVNLITLSKPVKIHKSENFSIKFIDDRLFTKDLIKGETYSLQYIFNVKQYEKMRKQINIEKIYSNIIEFEY